MVVKLSQVEVWVVRQDLVLCVHHVGRGHRIVYDVSKAHFGLVRSWVSLILTSEDKSNR
jgi:hypothetical protein